jgi:hypothetical protein
MIRRRLRKAQCSITFLNEAGMTLSSRGIMGILAHDTWKSLEFNLDVGSIRALPPVAMPSLHLQAIGRGYCREGPVAKHNFPTSNTLSYP